MTLSLKRKISSEAKNAQTQSAKKLAMNPSAVSHTDIGLRLLVCVEFLVDELKSDEEKPIEEVYRSWISRMQGQSMEFAEFEYWYKRFKNNQFDLGYDTKLDSMEISEIQNAMNTEANGKNEKSGNDEIAVISNKIASKGYKNTDYRFDVQNVPVIFQELVQAMSSIKTIIVTCGNASFSMSLNRFEIRFERNAAGLIEYGDGINKKTTSTTDPEKSVIDHLWFVLRDPNLKPSFVAIQTNFVFDNPLINFERMLSLMLGSFDHRLCINAIELDGLNEDTFVSFLKWVEPKKLTSISFAISWKEEGKYEKMKEIVELEQWKQASRITSLGISPLTVDDVLPFKYSYLCCDKITPEDVVRVRDHFSGSRDERYCTLSALRFYEKGLHYDEFEKALQSKNLHARLVREDSIDYFYTLPHSKKFLKVTVSELFCGISFAKTYICK